MKKVVPYCMITYCVIGNIFCMREPKYRYNVVYTADGLSRADTLEQSLQHDRNIPEITADIGALNLLIKYQREDAVKKLLREYRVKPTFESLAQAITVGNMPLALLCIEHDPQLLHGENRVGSVLHIASMANRVTLAKKFIDMGVDVNRRNLYYDTPLHIAAKLGYTAMVSLLCSAGANPFIKNMRSHGRSFDAMDMAYRHMLKAHRSEEAPHDYYHSYNIYRTILHIMYRYVDRFGGAVLGGAFV